MIRRRLTGNMMNIPQHNPEEQDRLDRATADRLAKLRGMPVDTTRLDKFLRAQFPPPARPGGLRRFWLRPMRAVAALLLLTGIVTAVLLTNSGGRALASPGQMAQMHEDIVS